MAGRRLRHDRIAARQARWLIGAVATVGLAVPSAGGVAQTAPNQPSARIEQSATGTATALRGDRTVLTQPPPPPVLHPAGTCDTLTDGLPGLNGMLAFQITQIGTSVQGRPIWAEYWGPPHPSNTIVVVGQIHGNECSPTLLVDEIRRRPPTRNGIWLIPTMNPDGYANFDRRNANGVDLNADGGSVSQPETAALFALLAVVRPALTVHVHSPNGFAGPYPGGASSSAGELCGSIAAFTAISCGSGGAGTRAERSRWFLWQGHASLTAQSLLVELHAVSNAEAPTARPRPATRSIDAVRSDARAVADLLDQFG